MWKVCLYIYIYILVYIEREREREINKRERERERERARQTCTGKPTWSNANCLAELAMTSTSWNILRAPAPSRADEGERTTKQRTNRAQRHL